jgi:type VI secretion system protein ImpH
MVARQAERALGDVVAHDFGRAAADRVGARVEVQPGPAPAVGGVFVLAPEDGERSLHVDTSRRAGEVDPLSFALLSFAGFGTDGLRGRMTVDDETFAYYSGHYSHQPRSAIALESLLADYFEAPVEVIQFQGRWITLALEERTCMPTKHLPKGRNCVLGVNAIAGARVWNMPTKFRVRIGPLPYARFRQFWPGADGHRRLSDLVRTYAGPELTFDIQPVLRREDVPCGELRGDRSQAFRLGWNSWSGKQPHADHADEAVFRSADD